MSNYTEKNRVVRLAETYGPFVRFSPEGNEDEEALARAIKEGEKADKEEFDKERQRADQEKANAEKARTSLAERETELETAQAETDSLKQQLADAEAKAASAGIELTELNEDDYSGGDISLVRTINALVKKVEASNKDLVNLQTKARGYEDQAVKDAVKRSSDAAYDEILADLDTEYGADCRNEAIKLFNKKIADGEVPKGKPAKAMRALEKCYQEVKKDKSSEKSSVKLDSGSGGSVSGGLSGIELRPGSLEDVVKQVATAAKTS